MENNRVAHCRSLLDKKLITDHQFERISAYRDRRIFSVRTELKAMLYLAVLLFTSGIGVLIYENIDTIGHLSVLGLLILVAGICFLFSFKNASGFARRAIAFEHPVYDYLVLAGVSLSCIFIAYLQFQYNSFGTQYGLATIIPTSISFFCAYYFDNKSSLSIGITGLVAYIGLTVSPQSLLKQDFYESAILSSSAILLGCGLVVWTFVASKWEFKKHFNFVYLNFALHLISLALLSRLFQENGLWYVIPLIGSSYYFYNASYKTASFALFAFTVLYAFVGFTVFAVRIIDDLGLLNDIFEGILTVSPIYFIALIVLFVKLIQNFNKKVAHDRIS